MGDQLCVRVVSICGATCTPRPPKITLIQSLGLQCMSGITVVAVVSSSSSTGSDLRSRHPFVGDSRVNQRRYLSPGLPPARLPPPAVLWLELADLSRTDLFLRLFSVPMRQHVQMKAMSSRIAMMAPNTAAYLQHPTIKSEL